MSLDPQGREVKKTADDILQRYNEEEFDIDTAKASAIEVSQYDVDAVTGEVVKGSELKHADETLSFAFSNSISAYQWRKDDPNPFRVVASARALVLAYNALRTHDCLRDGRSTRRRFAEMEGTASSLREQLQDVTKKLGVMEDRLRQCSDEKVELENRVKDQKERIDGTRAEDIRNSMKSKSETGEVKEE